MTSRFFHKIKLYTLCLLWTVLALPIFIGWKLYAQQDDLLYQSFYRPKQGGTLIDLWDSKEFNWKNVFGDGSNNKVWLIVRITRLLLILTIAISVTMILYNWMMYIIQTWQWKEWKSLITNIALIVVGILVALFSVVAIRLIQSVPTTLDRELTKDEDSIDRKAIGWEVDVETGNNSEVPGDSE